MKEEIYEELRSIYSERRDSIQAQLEEFKNVYKESDDRRIFEELSFCILTSAVGPKVGQKSLYAVKDILLEGTEEELEKRLDGVHKFPDKARFIVHTREYLAERFGFKLKDLVRSFDDSQERRDFFADNDGIKGLGYVQASHFLRNIGFTEYAILDKNVLLSLYEFGVIGSPKPASSKKRYIEVENKMKGFAEELGVTFEELDLLLWSRRTGYIPK